jgi:hypothetical protein
VPHVDPTIGKPNTPVLGHEKRTHKEIVMLRILFVLMFVLFVALLVYQGDPPPIVTALVVVALAALPLSVQ